MQKTHTNIFCHPMRTLRFFSPINAELLCTTPCNRLLDGQDQQVAPSAVSEFRAGVRPCSPPLTEHIISLVGQGLVWHASPWVTGEEKQEPEANSSRITCVSSLSQALHHSVHLPAQPHSFMVHESLWADEESFAAVMAFANYRRSVCAPARTYVFESATV